LVTFSYAHVPWVSKIQKKLEKAGIPEGEEKMLMFERGFELLSNNGYQAIGLDHFALKDDELSLAYDNKTLHRNFQGYCTTRTTGQVYALGVTAISQLNGVYSQNTKSIADYIEISNKGEISTLKGYKLTDEQIIVREVITELMCNEQVVWDEIGKRYSKTGDEIKDIIVYDTDKLKEFEADGIIRLSEEKIEVTKDGLILIRNVAASFDPILLNSDKTFSKSV
jgi:oxygen-independent coproporphyrinogen-3 oxidase